MIPTFRVHSQGNEIRPDEETFLRKVGFRLLGLLIKRGVEPAATGMNASNDVLLLRGTAAMVAAFSHRRRMPEMFGVAYDMAQVAPGWAGLALPEPMQVHSPQINDLLAKTWGFERPVLIAFPLSYLALNGEEANVAVEKVAQLLVGPAVEDFERQQRIVRANPIFRGRDFMLDPDLCFVLMEFGAAFEDVYASLIKPTVEGQEMRCVRADELTTTEIVIEDIWENINRAALIIAEISSVNPNVMYELGICHTMGKEVMMLTQNPGTVPFNFRHMRFYPYTNDISGAKTLQSNIESIIKALRSNNAK